MEWVIVQVPINYSSSIPSEDDFNRLNVAVRNAKLMMDAEEVDVAALNTAVEEWNTAVHAYQTTPLVKVVNPGAYRLDLLEAHLGKDHMAVLLQTNLVVRTIVTEPLKTPGIPEKKKTGNIRLAPASGVGSQAPPQPGA